jgi:peptidoglycan/LPS O-acetylase OafA/YrhL
MDVTVSGYGPWVAFFKFSPIVHLPQFLLGVATGVIFLRTSSMKNSYARSLLPVIASVAVIVALAVSDRIPYLLLADGVLAPLFALLIFSLAWGSGPIVDLLSTKTATLLGGASYALYLIHLPLVNYLTRFWILLTRQRPSGILLFTVFVLTAIGLSIVIFHFIEQPARRALRARGPWNFSGRVKRIALHPVW